MILHARIVRDLREVMKKFAILFFFLHLAAAAALAAPRNSSFERIVPRPEGSGVFFRPILCVGEDYPSERSSEARIRSDMALLRQLKIQHLRCGFSWYEIEPERGQFKWAHWDLLARVADESGITLLPYVCYTPDWAARSLDNVIAQPPRDLSDYGRFMGRIAERYRGRIHTWELWNEPDLDQWEGTPEEFYQMIREAAAQVRRANPQAKIVLGGMARGPGDFFRELVRAGPLEQFIDIFAFHDYMESWMPERLEETLPRWPEAMAELIDQRRSGAPLWLNEYGYPDYRHDANHASEWVQRPDIFYDYEHTAEHQATMLMRTHLLALASGRVSLIAWYRLRDYEDLRDVGGVDAINLHLGLVDAQGRPKPSFRALYFFNELFDAPVRCADRAIKVQAPSDSQAIVHAFEREDGGMIIAGWLRSSRYEEVKDHSGMAVDRRRESVCVELPRLGLGPGRRLAFDAQGRPVAAAGIYDPEKDALSLTLEGPGIQIIAVPPAD